MMRHFRILLLFLLVLPLAAEARIKGIVLDDNGMPLVGANVYWAGTTTGVATDTAGLFSIEPVHATRLLVSSYLGYHNDTTDVGNQRTLTIVLVSDLILDEVSITERQMSVLRSRVSPLNVETLTGQELTKAACCNLSESFETSASVDVAYSDAATGAKQIRLLGLSGTYVQLLTENTPNVRGLAQSFGMEYIPGPWMESIQVSKGTSSVINGYEAITGQINVEYLKPQTTNPIAVNAMLNSALHAELNATGGWDIGEHTSTAVLLHAQDGSWEMDDNGDGFVDMPKNHNLNLLNRWFFHNGNYTGQVLVRALYDQRIGGQITRPMHGHTAIDNPYRIDLRTRRIDGFMKNGYVFDAAMDRSIGIIAAASYHSLTNHYGTRLWDANQTNAYLNAIFQTRFDTPSDPFGWHTHKLSAGLSVNFDRYSELLHAPLALMWINTPQVEQYDFSRMETTPGVFAEYTYSYREMLTLLMGVRADYSTRYGFFFTPRMNIRYAPFEWWTLRASAGMGYRSPNAIADNAAYLPSNRVYAIGNEQLAQEKTVNAGITTMFYIPLGKRELHLSAEYYYTHFLDGVIADMDADLHRVELFNISSIANAQSFAHNWQVEANMEVLRGWTLTAAFRYTDVRQTTFSTADNAYILRDKPLQNKFKALLTTSYQTPLHTWQFDFTAQFNGYGRMPDGFTVPEGSRQYMVRNGYLYHRWYPQLLAQITKYWRTCSLYVGAENMTNFRQDAPIVGDKITATPPGDKMSAGNRVPMGNRVSVGNRMPTDDRMGNRAPAGDRMGNRALVGERMLEGGTMSSSQYIDPSSANYDASMVWGPIHGWKVYIGFRWSLDRPE